MTYEDFYFIVSAINDEYGYRFDKFDDDFKLIETLNLNIEKNSTVHSFDVVNEGLLMVYTEFVKKEQITFAEIYSFPNMSIGEKVRINSQAYHKRNEVTIKTMISNEGQILITNPSSHDEYKYPVKVFTVVYNDKLELVTDLSYVPYNIPPAFSKQPPYNNTDRYGFNVQMATNEWSKVISPEDRSFLEKTKDDKDIESTPVTHVIKDSIGQILLISQQALSIHTFSTMSSGAAGLNTYHSYTELAFHNYIFTKIGTDFEIKWCKVFPSQNEFNINDWAYQDPILEINNNYHIIHNTYQFTKKDDYSYLEDIIINEDGKIEKSTLIDYYDKEHRKGKYRIYQLINAKNNEEMSPEVIGITDFKSGKYRLIRISLAK
jgi:hypothetical protein